MDPQTIDAIKRAVQEAFSAEGGDRRFVDITRIPLICQSIVSISTDIKDINEKLDEKFVTKEAFWPVKTIVFGFVGLMLIALIGAMLYTILPHGAVFVQP